MQKAIKLSEINHKLIFVISYFLCCVLFGKSENGEIFSMGQFSERNDATSSL